MKHLLLWLAAAFAAPLFLSSCGPGADKTQVKTAPADERPQDDSFRLRDDSYYERRNREDEDRGKVLKDKYGGGECEDNKACEKICRALYRKKEVRDECLELSIAAVETLESLKDIFEKPKEDELNAIESADFKLFVELDLRPLESLIGKMSGSESKRLIEWIVGNEDIAEIFNNEDDEYKMLEDLLENLVASGDDRLQKALAKNIQDGQSFIELAIEDGGKALDWIHGLVEDKCKNSATEELCIFQDWYCKMSLDSDGEDWIDLLNNEDFASVMDDILSDYSTESAAGQADAAGAGARADSKPAEWWEDGTESSDVEQEEFHKMCSWKGRTGSTTPALSADAPNIVKKP